MPKLTRFLSLLALLSGAALSAAPITSRGTDFWLAMPPNIGAFPPDVITLYLSAGPAAAVGTVTVPGLGLSYPFNVPANTVGSVNVDASAYLGPTGSVSPYDATESKGMHVSSSQPLAVYAFNLELYSTDAFLALPTPSLGVDYYVLSYGGTLGSSFAVVAPSNGTLLTITPPVALAGHAAGTPYTVALSQGQTYLLQEDGTADATGTHIQSNLPVAVIQSNKCADVPTTSGVCDFLAEESFPTSAWGQTYFSVPLATRSKGDAFRVLADTDGTVVSINGTATTTLNHGQFWEAELQGLNQITASQPVMVAQYSNGVYYDNAPNNLADPFEMLLVPYEDYDSNYLVASPNSGFTYNFINLVTPLACLGAITVDGVTLPAAGFSPIGGTGFYGLAVTSTAGAHSVSAPCPIGVSVYGFDVADGYGYPGGLALAPVASVAKLVLNPKTASQMVGQTDCVTATATDSGGAPVVGVRVDFTSAGANPGAGFAFTDANGQALFCYVGNNGGTDLLTASLGSLKDTAQCTWSIDTPTPSLTPTITPTFTVTPSVTASPTVTLSATITPSPTATPPPLSLFLLPANPDPARDWVWMPFHVTEDSWVDIQVYDVSGEKIRALDPVWTLAGYAEQSWDLENDAHNRVSSGVYIYRVRARDQRGVQQHELAKCAVVH